MPFLLDHVIVVVPSLAEGVAAFTEAGFTVTPGGRHAELPTENALVPFADGTYLELLAARDPDVRTELRARAARPQWPRQLHEAAALGRRFLPLLAGHDGIADLVVHGVPLTRFAREARARGHVLTGPTPMQRVRPDGVTLAWQLVLPEAAGIPFMIEDVTPREQRVPTEAEATTHRNGASGIAEVGVRVEGVPMAGLAWADLFGWTPRVGMAGETRFALEAASVSLRAGAPAGVQEVTLRGVAELPARLREWGLRTQSG